MRHHGLSKESACFFSFFFKRRFFSLFGPDINRLQSIPQEPLVISCLHFHSVGEVMSDFTFTQRLKKIAYQFLALLQLLYKNKLASLHTSRRPVSKQGLSEAAGYYAGKQKTMPVLEEFTKMFSKSLKKRSSEKMELSHYCCGYHEVPLRTSRISTANL